MPVLNFVDREGDRHSAAAERGLSVMEVIRNSGRGDILALCGGMKSCATCHVYVSEAWFDRLGAIDEDEDDLLDSSGERRPTSRLSCQIVMVDALDGLDVTIAPEQ